jgi:hypothetical protein
MDGVSITKLSRTGAPKSKGGCATCRYPAPFTLGFVGMPRLTGIVEIEGSNATKESHIVSAVSKPSERAVDITL